MGKRWRPMDTMLLSAVLTLLGFGMVMMFSASSVVATVSTGNPYYYLERQIIWSILGLGLMFFFARIDYHRLLPYAEKVAYVTAALLVAVLIPHIGHDINGGRRWLGVGSVLFQPSELSKFSLVLLFAKRMAGERRIRHFTYGILQPLLILLFFAALIVKEPDLGTALSLTGTVFAMLFVAGVNLYQFFALVVSVVPVVGILILTSRYRLQRIVSFLDPQNNPQGAGYHIIQSLYALGSGGLFGVGLGQGALKYFYLPEQYTDFIFAIIGEELGLVGTVMVIALFLFVAWRGMRIAMLAPDRFGALLATGLTAMVVIQALMNIAVVTASMPITGIPLPFISYGGSSLVFALGGMGVLLSISRQLVSA